MYTAYFLIDPTTGIVRYIGLTKKTLQERLQRHLSDGRDRNPYKYNWIQKLKRNGFIPEIIIYQDDLSEEKACELEVDLIRFFRILSGKKLTNIEDGGVLPPNWAGKTHTKESKKKMSDKRKKPVWQLEMNGRFVKKFASQQEASRATGIDDSHIAKCCKKKLKSTGGFKWRYA